jgi:transposase
LDPKYKTRDQKYKFKKLHKKPIMTNPISNNLRLLIIKNYNEGKKPKEISLFLGFNINTTYKIIQLYKSSGRTVKLSQDGYRWSKLSLEEKSTVRDWVDDNPTISLSRIVSKIQTGMNKCVSTDCVFR